MAGRNKINRNSLRRSEDDSFLGVSTLGNTAGTTAVREFDRFVFAGSNGITLSQLTSGQSATLVISGAGAGGGVALSAGTQSVSTGTMVFANSNGIVFGMSGSNQITASYSQSTAPGAIAAGGSTLTNGSLVFTNSNGISFGFNGSTLSASHDAVSQVGAQDFGGGAGLNNGIQRWVWASNATCNVAFTKSVGAGGNSTQASIFARAQAVAVGAAGSTQTSGTVELASTFNSCDVAFAFNAGTLTASHGALTQVSFEAPSASAANKVFSNRLIFGDRGGISFTISGLSTSQTIIAGPNPVSAWENLAAAAMIAGNMRPGTESPLVYFQRAAFGAPLAASRLDLLISITSANTQQAASHTLRFGMYTMSGSTASLASSGSRTFAFNSTLGVSNISNATAYNQWSIPLNMNISPGDYLMGFQMSISTVGTLAGYTIAARRDLTIQGREFSTGPFGQYFQEGAYSVSSGSGGALPTSVHVTDIVVSTNGVLDGCLFFPWFRLVAPF